jgi:tellurium resistance protein TerD
MRAFRISGVDKSTGNDTQLTIEAQSEANARVKAELKGMIVTSIEDVFVLKQPSSSKCNTCYFEKNEILTLGKPTGKYICLHCDLKSGLCPACQIPLDPKNSMKCKACDSTWASQDLPKQEEKKTLDKIEVKDEEIKCPSCKSTQITATKKGFGLGKAAIGGILLGPLGLLGGAIGSNKVKVTCIKCGYTWNAGSNY